MAEIGPATARVVVAAASPADLRQLTAFVREAGLQVIGETQDGNQALSLARDSSPDLVVSNVNLAASSGLALTEQIWAELPTVGCVLVAEEGSWGAHRRAMQAGALDFILPPLGPEAIDSLQAALRQARKRRSLIGSTRGTVAPRGQRPERAAPVIAVVSAKGGVGRTTVAASVAAALASDGSTILCDLDLQFGDLSGWGAKAAPDRSLAQLSAVVRAGEVGPADISAVALANRFGSVTVLPAPRSPLDGTDWSVCFSQMCPLSVSFQPTSAASYPAAQLVDRVRAWYQWVIVDSMAGLFDPVVATLRLATMALVVTTCEVGALRATRSYLDILDKIAPMTRIVVANRARRGDAETLVQQALGGRDKVVFVPDDAEYARKMILDAPPPAQLKDRKAAKAFAELTALTRQAVSVPA